MILSAEKDCLVSQKVKAARTCVLGVPKTKFYILTPFSQKNANFRLIIDGPQKISAQNRL